MKTEKLWGVIANEDLLDFESIGYYRNDAIAKAVSAWGHEWQTLKRKGFYVTRIEVRYEEKK